MDVGNAGLQVDAAGECLSVLPEKGYGAMIRSGIERVGTLLDAEEVE